MRGSNAVFFLLGPSLRHSNVVLLLVLRVDLVVLVTLVALVGSSCESKVTGKVRAHATRMCRALAVPYSQLSLALPRRANARGFGLVASGFGLACADTSATPRRTFFLFVGLLRRAVLSQHVRAVSMILSKDSRSIPSNDLGVSLAAGKRRLSRSLPLAN